MDYFYNPKNGMIVSSINYKFQSNITSEAFFGFKYQPGIIIYCLDKTNSIFAPFFSLDFEVYIHSPSPPSIAKVVGIPTYTTPNIYTVVFKDGSISEYTADLLSAVPTCTQMDESMPFYIICQSHYMVLCKSIMIMFGLFPLENRKRAFCLLSCKVSLYIYIHIYITQNQLISLNDSIYVIYLLMG
jgi:hypothetical protein